VGDFLRDFWDDCHQSSKILEYRANLSGLMAAASHIDWQDSLFILRTRIAKAGSEAGKSSCDFVTNYEDRSRLRVLVSKEDYRTGYSRTFIQLDQGLDTRKEQYSPQAIQFWRRILHGIGFF